MPVAYDPALVALSIVIAIQGGYVSLTLAQRLRARTGPRRKALLAASAVSLGVGVWAMHFIGMLAVKLPVAVNYDLLLTLVSALVCVLVVGLGVFTASFGPLTPARLAFAGLLMGCGISTMHFIGMSALQANCLVSYSPGLVGASVVVSVAASSLALWLAFADRRRHSVLAGAAAMGLAISGMHYTAMAAATFLPADVLVAISTPVLSLDLLAIVVAVIAFLISGVFLLVFLPDRLGGPQRAEFSEPAGVAPEPGSDFTRVDRIPVSYNGATLLLPPEQICAIRADAHYSRVFDGTETYFCPLSISQLEARLDPDTFVRVHRSHIVNVRRAAALRRVRSQGLVQFDSAGDYTVPVSRSRMRRLQTALGL